MSLRYAGEGGSRPKAVIPQSTVPNSMLTGSDQRQKGVTLGLSQPAGTNAFRPATTIGKSQIGKHITIERVDRIDIATRTGDRFRQEKGKRFEDYLKTLP